MSVHLDFRKPPYNIQDQCTSWSGKYHCFLGHHYHAGVLCWVVGSSNAVTGEIVARHYNEKFQGCLSQEHAKGYALAVWKELKQGMLKAPEAEEHNDWEKELENWFDRADAAKRRRPN